MSIGLHGPITVFMYPNWVCCSFHVNFELQLIFFWIEKFWENHHKSQILENCYVQNLSWIWCVLLCLRVISCVPHVPPVPPIHFGVLGYTYKAKSFDLDFAMIVFWPRKYFFWTQMGGYFPRLALASPELTRFDFASPCSCGHPI